MSFLHDYLIWIDPDWLDDETKPRFTTPQAYESWVLQIIRSIEGSQVGKIVLKSIRFHGRAVRIAPLPFMDTSSASADWGKSKDLQFNRGVRPVLNAFAMNFPAVRAIVLFTPHHYAAGGVHHRRYILDKHDYTPSLESVLLHELVHAFRAVSGKYDPDPQTYGGLAKFDAIEEFFAILVENIFQSEMNRNIRAHHQGFYNLEKELVGSFEFFKASVKAFRLVEKFCKENPGLTRALSKVKVSFNPLAAYYKDPKKAASLSRSESAVNRDLGPLKSIAPLSPGDWAEMLDKI